jgi:hypothetical protein
MSSNPSLTSTIPRRLVTKFSDSRLEEIFVFLAIAGWQRAVRSLDLRTTTITKRHFPHNDRDAAIPHKTPSAITLETHSTAPLRVAERLTIRWGEELVVVLQDMRSALAAHPITVWVRCF